MLTHALASGRVPHAQLFSGPPGVGKAATALLLAQALNCEGAAPQPCGACGPCDRIARGIHPDVVRVEPTGAARQITKEQIDAVRTRLALPPHEARVRVFILDDAERMNPTSANQILKTLEEPPPRTLFVLVTAAPEQLLPTIRSRCQRVRFAPLPLDLLTRLLSERFALAAPVARAAAAIAGGSVGRALGGTDAEVVAARRDLGRRVRDAVGAAGTLPVVDLAADLKQGAEREEVGAALELLVLYYRDAALVAEGADPARLVHDDPELANVAAAGGARLSRAAQIVTEAQAAVAAFAAVDLMLEQMMFRLRAAQATG